MKLLSLFSGIGAFEKALTNLNIDYDLVNYCEIDKFASNAYCLINDESEIKNLWDITKVNEKELPDFDLLTYGFPCQSFSIAGKRLGLNDEKRGNMFFESMRIAKEKKPKFMVAENVKGLLSDDNGSTMNLIITTLDKLGYNNYFQVLNAKDYGIPQNRERIFIISIRKSIDNLSFEFPEKIELKIKLQDIIENGTTPNEESYCLDANYSKGVSLEYFLKKKRRQIVIINDKFSNNRKPREYTEYSPCLLDCMPKIKIIAQRGRYKTGNKTKQMYEENKKGLVNTLTSVQKDNLIKIEHEEIRKLTTKECFRLMGFTDKDHNKLESISNTQKYKMAGNSIVVQVLEGIFKQLFLSDNKKRWLF